MKYKAIDYLNLALKATSNDIGKIAKYIGLNKNTVNRWIKDNKVPNSYLLDLSRFVGNSVIPSESKDKDQFYTKPSTAELCYTYLKDTLEQLTIDTSNYTFIEPSAGKGCFYSLLPPTKRIAIDIDPQFEEVISSNYLDWKPPSDDKKYIVIGNPPFGLRGHLALQFINHSYDFADVVGFILPQLFESDGKGVPAKRVKGYTLAMSKKLARDSFRTRNGEDINIHTVFQVWTKIHTHKIQQEEKHTCNEYVRVVSLSDGGTPSSTRNKHLIGKCDVYIPSTCYKDMKPCFDFESLPHRRGYGVVIKRNKEDIMKIFKEVNLEQYSFYSTNSALNIRKSLIEKILIDKGYRDTIL